MEVNKKQLADIFGASIRTIQNWQEQGMPVLRGGGKGNEVLYDSAAVIKWYAERDAEIENEKLRREVEELRQASEADLQPGTIEYERHRLTRAQADAQELKNARDSAEVVETAFCTFVLSRIAGEIASILDGIPLSVQRRFPELENRHVDFLKRDIIKAMNKAAALDELITESHLGKELLEKVELTEDNASKLEEFSKEWQDANDKWNAMWGVKIEQTKDGKHYVAGIGLSMEDTEEGKLSQFLVAANRIAFIDPANGNETPMFVAQGNQIFMNDVFLKRLTAPTITSGGNPPAFSLTSDGKLTAKNADISGSVNANAGTLNNVTVNENCTIKGMLEATQVRGDFVKAVSKSFPKQAGTWGNTETPNGTVTVTISDDHNFDRQIIIPPIIFNGIAYSDPGSGNNPGGTRYTGYGFEVRKNGVLIASRETKGAIPGSYSAVIDMPSGRGSVTLEFKVFHKGNQRAGNITDCTVIVTKKAASGISIR
ncbi:DUF1983 domain-containing protein [Escherichia coli]|nr:DUF1983 domain-containing protein [Escherichia coli]EOV54542.1 terminase small subunit [Escherichia coli KTE61]EFJ9646452.1 DUF1983 domain-containing protein [Escherichia coli]EFK2268195.1 DUF1983 domain-containing protein [Escherichia coli]EFK2786586.1 DUF1983 domain-containing protein [Escherichia coli]